MFHYFYLKYNVKFKTIKYIHSHFKLKVIEAGKKKENSLEKHL